MFTYILGAASVIVMCSVALVYILVKYNMIKSNYLATIGASTITGSLFLPAIKAIFLKLSAVMSVFTGIIISGTLFLLLIFCVSYVAAGFLLDKNLGRYIGVAWSTWEERLPGVRFRKKEVFAARGHNRVFAHIKYGIVGLGSIAYAPNVISPVELKPGIKDNGESKNLVKEQQKVVELPERLAVKVAEPCEEENLEQCIEKAFDLKGAGLVEEALLYYRRILSLKPEKELAAWVCIEICSIYKELGQLARVSELLEEIRDLTKPEVLEAIERSVA